MVRLHGAGDGRLGPKALACTGRTSWLRRTPHSPVSGGSPQLPYRACREFGIAANVLVLTQPTSTFVALQHPVGLPFYGLGTAALFFHRNRLQGRQPAATTAARDDQPGQQSSDTSAPSLQPGTQHPRNCESRACLLQVRNLMSETKG